MAGADLPSFHGIIGRSAVMQALFQRIATFARRDVSVLIQGETGTGKDLVAATVQGLSARRDHPYEVLNCATLTRELLASELFGHERGAFTDAVTSKQGLLALAHGGTVFLDHVGELPQDTQGMLLRFLEGGDDLAVTGLAAEAMAAMTGHGWAGNVRALAKVLREAMLVREEGWVQLEDLRIAGGASRRPFAKAGGAEPQRAPVARVLSPEERREAVLAMARQEGAVTRRQVVAQCGVSREAARRDLRMLAMLKLLRPVGKGRATRYVPV